MSKVPEGMRQAGWVVQVSLNGFWFTIRTSCMALKDDAIDRYGRNSYDIESSRDDARVVPVYVEV